MARVTVEDCVTKIPNRFELVMMAAQRARSIAAGAELTLDRDNDKNPVVALREIADETIDLDLLAFGDLVTGLADGVLVPHPRMHERAFVLLPLRELAPGWRHPVSGLGVGDLIAALPPGQVAEPMDGAPAPPASAGRRG